MIQARPVLPSLPPESCKAQSEHPPRRASIASVTILQTGSRAAPNHARAGVDATGRASNDRRANPALPGSQCVERAGKRPEEWHYRGFLSTTEDNEVDALTRDLPKRGHVEEFFNANQALGWKRAGTTSPHISFGQMTMALIAQAAIHQLRTRLGEPFAGCDAIHLARDGFLRIDGDVRVTRDTIMVTCYNAPNTERLRHHCEDLPGELAAQNVPSEMPWPYAYRLDFRFR